MINIEATIRLKGYNPNDLKPNSHKRVWAICERCGRGRWIQFRRANRSCFECSPSGGGTQTDEGKKILSDNAKKYIGNKNPNWKGGGTEKICPVCGNIFLTQHSNSEKRQCCSRDCSSILHQSRMSGDKNPAWRGGKIKNIIYGSRLYENWRKEIFERDNYTCQECGHRGGNLNAHHILPYRDWREEKYSLNINNGITLCTKCHQKTYGKEYEFFSKYFDIIHGVNII